MGEVLTATIEVIVQNLINVLNEEYSQIRHLHEDAKKLQMTLCIIQGYLIDAEEKFIRDNAVKSWLRELHSFAFDADNVLDELSYHLLHKQVMPKQKVLLSRFSFFSHCLRSRNIAVKIKEINTEFEAMVKLARELNLESLVVNAPAAAAAAAVPCRETDSKSMDPIFIGRDKEVSELVKLMLSESVKEQTLSIFAIFGMGGLGKTTLTRKVFNHESIKNRFGSLVWVHVSQTFDPIILFKKILLVLTEGAADVNQSREVILKKLQEAFEDKTYLLVLDDVWNEDLLKWDDFINSIRGVTRSTKGNGIMVTTRNDGVASTVRPFHVHPLRGLSDEECWSIIKAKAFENGDASGFEVIGRKIAKRCQGLPLAANVVGGVLRGKSEHEWHSINENRLSDGAGGGNILKILKLSYDNLSSPSLKKCFAYCSVFRKGETMVKEELIEFWMAEGYLGADDRNNEMEAVGNNFFNVLLHNSLLLVADRDKFGNVWSCAMHDLVHDVATSVLQMDGSDSNQHRYMIHDEPNPIPKESAKYVRTLFFKGKISGSTFSDFECLHALTITSDEAEELPNSIRGLIHLRKLDISNTRIKSLPEWIGELHHLQTLRADTWRLKKLPSTLKYLIRLRHLYLHSFVEFPAGIGRLTCLQTLDRFNVGSKSGCRIEELGNLNNLKGRLEINNLENVHDKEEALKANIFQKTNLSHLSLFWWNPNREGENNDKSVLEGLQPHPNISELSIWGFRDDTFPLWTMKMAVRDGPEGSWIPLNKLTSITLSWCEECEEIPTLEHLPSLKSLTLWGLNKVRFINSSFNNLTSLSIYGLEGLECLPNWLFYNNQTLSHIWIHRCPKLNELPDGLHTLKSLEGGLLSACPNLKSIGTPPSVGILKSLRIHDCPQLHFVEVDRNFDG